MKKTSFKGIVIAALVLIALGGAYYAFRGLTRSPAPVLSFDGTEITLGSSCLEDLYPGGFKPSTQTLEPGTWDKYALYKDDEFWGSVRLKNTSISEKDKARCQIFAAEVDYARIPEGSFLVGGVDFAGLTPEQAEELLPGFTRTDERGNAVYYADKSFTYRFTFEDGSVTGLLVADGTDAVYQDGGIEFGSY